MKKKIFAIAFTMLMIIVCSVALAKTDSGEYKGIKWNFDNGTLSLEGEGLIPSNAPWDGCYKQVRELIIGEKISGLEDWAEFDHMPKLQKIIYYTNDFEESFPMAELIKEVEYRGPDPEFRGINYIACRLNKITFFNAQNKYVQDGKFLFNKDRTELYYYLGVKKEKVAIPEGVRIIKDSAFANSNITAIDFPSTLEEIGRDAFGNCNQLTKIEVPASCKVIGAEAFCGCSSLKEIKFNHDEIELRGYYYVRDERIQSGFTFAGCTSLKEIVLPSCEEIPDSIFAGCKNLKKVVFGEKTRKIVSGQSFMGCLRLESVYVPDDMDFDDKFFIGMGSEPPKKAVILCHAGSHAEELAKIYGMKYKVVE